MKLFHNVAVEAIQTISRDFQPKFIPKLTNAEVVYTPSEIWLERYPGSASDTKQLLKESEIYRNLIKDVEMMLIAVK
jgi:hypothetical protein